MTVLYNSKLNNKNKRKVYNSENLPINLFPKHLQDRVRWLVNLVETNHHINDLDAYALIPLKAKYLIKILGFQNYYDIKKILVHIGWLQSDNSWIEGKKCMGYRLNPELNHNIKQFEIDDSFLKEPEDLRNYRGIKKLLWEDLQFFDIDANSALTWIKDNGEPRNSNFMQASVLKIATKDFQFSRDEFGFRINSTITNAKKEIRKFLTCQNDKVCEIDIKNSHPLNSAIIHELLKNNNSNNNSNTQYDNLKLKLCSKTSQLLKKISFQEEEIPDEKVAHYSSLVQEGKLYEFVMDKLGIDRGSAKKTILFLLNGEIVKSPIRELFQEYFPHIVNLTNSMKRIHYTHASMCLQRFESILIIDDICVRIKKEFPESRITTVHDSILTTEQFVEPIANIIKETYFELFKMKVQIEIS